MDRGHLEQMLNELRQERTEAEHQLAALQRRVDALRKAAEGIEDLLGSEPSQPVEANRTGDADTDTKPDTASTVPLAVPRTSSSIPTAEPRGGDAARQVLRSAPGRYLTAREVWEEEVRQGWAEPTADGRAAVRVALKRLCARDQRVRLLAGPTHAYCWENGSTASAANNGSKP